MRPITNRRFWFYNDWEGGFAKASDEYGHHTVVIPFGKGRAVCIAYRAGYKQWKHCEFCALARRQTLEWEQECLYVQYFHGLDDFDDVYDLSNDEWDYAVGRA